MSKVGDTAHRQKILKNEANIPLFVVYFTLYGIPPPSEQG